MKLWSKDRITRLYVDWTDEQKAEYTSLVGVGKLTQAHPGEAATAAARKVSGITEEVEAETQTVVDIFGGEVTSVGQAKRMTRNTDPSTSLEAALSVKVRASQEAVLSVLRKASKPMCDQEIRVKLAVDGVDMSRSGARTRRSELVAAGMVVDSGERGRTEAGRRTVLWEVAKK